MILTSKLIWIDDLLKQEYMLGEFVYNKIAKAPFFVYFPAAVALLHCISWQEKNVSVSSNTTTEQNVFRFHQ
jgi:hypothetical protein